MKIEHAALYVNDLNRARDFFTTYFQAQPGDVYHNPKTGFTSIFLSFPDGPRLEIMTREKDLEDLEKPLTRTGFAHICFELGSREAVDELSGKIQNDGYTWISGPRVTGDGYYESCFLDAEGNQIEISA